MRMADVVECDAGTALAEHRAGWLDDPGLVPATDRFGTNPCRAYAR